MAYASRDHFSTSAIKIDPAKLAMRIVVHHIVTGLADLEIKFVVGTNGDELPAVCFVLWQIGVDHRGLGRLVELILYIFDLGDLRQLGDVKRTVVVGETIRAIESFGHRLDLRLAVLL